MSILAPARYWNEHWDKRHLYVVLAASVPSILWGSQTLRLRRHERSKHDSNDNRFDRLTTSLSTINDVLKFWILFSGPYSGPSRITKGLEGEPLSAAALPKMIDANNSEISKTRYFGSKYEPESLQFGQVADKSGPKVLFAGSLGCDRSIYEEQQCRFSVPGGRISRQPNE